MASAQRPSAARTASANAVVKVVFIALVLDLLAFTMPLPLFPRLLDFYTLRESSDPSTLLARSLAFFRTLRAHLASSPLLQRVGGGRWFPSLADGTGITGANKKWDVVLLGGAMGSVFSLCQCLISPFLGSLSDRYGRKKVLMATMVGNIISAAVWLQSTSFASFLLSRLIGGLSEGNVQLSTAIISDVTTASARSKSLALIGLAFSVCFTFGPSIGAYFASRPLPVPAALSATSTNIYAYPAAISLALLVAETAYLGWALPETRWWGAKKGGNTHGAGAEEADEKATAVQRESVQERRRRIDRLGRVHGVFLLCFSGAEFTLTFLTYDLFSATNRQNGMLLSYIGILSSLLQGGHVRPSLSKGRTSELTFARRGMLACATGLVLMALLPLPAIKDGAHAQRWLYAIATALSYTSGTVVTGLMAAAAACCDEDGDAPAGALRSERLPKGRALGGFRSKGQLGRAFGPLLATFTYWTLGPTFVYGVAAVCLGALALSVGGMVRGEVARHKLKRA